jgi:dihydrofolate synthase/folylpolyglutamate synthase
MISEDFITQFVAKTRALSESIEPSFFELTVAMAFEYFAEKKVDVAVIETGLGGRLDSTNIITPILSVITNIGWDHMNLLGDTLPKIAFEKAGIIKPKIPVVIGEYIDITKPIFEEKATVENAPILYAYDLYAVNAVVPQSTRLNFNVTEIKTGKKWPIETDLNGLYQVKNIRTVLAAVEQIKQSGFHLTDDTVLTALKKVKPLTGLMGRWDVVAENPTIVIDVAHNEDGMKQVLHQIQVAPPKGNVHFIMGMVKDKDVHKILALLPSTAQYYFSQAHIPRAMDAADLQSLAANYQLSGDTYNDVNIALKAALANAQEEDMIIICGSVFLAGEVEVSLLLKNSNDA